MSTFRSIFVLSIFIQFAVCLTLIEDLYLTKQLMNYFGDDLDENSSGEKSDSKSNENEGERLISFDDMKVASLLSAFDIKERADHYWTRLGHRTRTKTTPEYGWETYYYNYAPNSGGYGSYYGGRRKKRHAKNKRSIIQRLKRQIENEKNDGSGMFTKNQQNYTSDLPKPMFDYKFRKGFNKCCADTDESSIQQSEKIQFAKWQCLQVIRNNRTKADENSTAVNDDGGFNNIFSCDKSHRWKATVTCTIDCMAQKLEMINSNGEINIEKSKSIIKENFAAQNWQQNVTDEAVDRCHGEISKTSPNTVLEKFGLKCNTKMAEFIYCLWREYFLACPAEKQQKMKHCEKLRHVLKRNNENKLKN